MKLTKQQLENWKAWIAAAESGEYQQGNFNLVSSRVDNCFCIMGLACKVMGLEILDLGDDGKRFDFGDETLHGCPPGVWFRDNFGIEVSHEFSEYDMGLNHAPLWKLNDSYDVTFPEFAKIFKAQVIDVAEIID